MKRDEYAETGAEPEKVSKVPAVERIVNEPVDDKVPVIEVAVINTKIGEEPETVPIPVAPVTAYRRSKTREALLAGLDRVDRQRRSWEAEEVR